MINGNKNILANFPCTLRVLNIVKTEVIFHTLMFFRYFVEIHLYLLILVLAKGQYYF